MVKIEWDIKKPDVLQAYIDQLKAERDEALGLCKKFFEAMTPECHHNIEGMSAIMYEAMTLLEKQGVWTDE